MEVQTTLEDELIWLEDFLSMLQRRFKGVEIVFIFGNHEHRLERFIIDKCPWFWNKLKLEAQLRLEEKGIKVVQYNERYQVDKTNLFIQHSPPSYAKNPAQTSLDKKIDQDHIWGCTHRTSFAVFTASSGKVYTSYTGGWFGSRGIIRERQNKMPENKRVFAFTKNHETWNCSLHLVTTAGPIHHVQQVLIKKIGQKYSASIGNLIYFG